MRNWFPFTDYDFYGYLASGFVLLFAADYALTGGAIMLRKDWTFVETVLAVSVAYFAGQIAASPSSVLLEHWLARRVLRPPIALMIGAAPMRKIDSFLAKWVVGRYYEPLPEATRTTILEKAAAAQGKSVEEIAGDPEAVFGPAFVAARQNEDARQRMDDFRNQYGLNRNMAFTALLSTALFLGKVFYDGDDRTYLFAGFALLLAVGLFARFLKFYSAFAGEVLRIYAFDPENRGRR
jgi:hypothetical protein